MNLIHELFQSLNPARQADVIARCTVYRSRTPDRVAYQSAADAHAHESGYRQAKANQPKPSGPGYTPERAGYDEAVHERSREIRDQEGADHDREEHFDKIARGE